MTNIGVEIEGSIHEFMQRKVRPNEEYLDEEREVIDTIVKALHKQSEEIGIKEIIKGGSLGKGTAVKGKSDIDLLVVIGGYYVDDLERDITRRNLLTKMGKKFEEAVERSGAVCKFIKKTCYSVQFKLRTRYVEEWHDVDILPTADLDVVYEKRDIYREMKAKSESNRTFYSGSLAKLQIEFVKTQSPKVKDAIRFIKYWIKTNKIDLISYGIELTAIHVWESSTGEQSLQDLIIAVLTELMSFRKFAISWNENYGASLCEPMEKPYIRDPANPFMNVIYRTETVRQFNRIETQAGQIRAFLRPKLKKRRRRGRRRRRNKNVSLCD